MCSFLCDISTTTLFCLWKRLCEQCYQTLGLSFNGKSCLWKSLCSTIIWTEWVMCSVQVPPICLCCALFAVFYRIECTVSKESLLSTFLLLLVALWLHLMCPLLQAETSLWLRTHVVSLWSSIFLLSCCSSCRRCSSIGISYWWHVNSTDLSMLTAAVYVIVEGILL